jgi:phosphoglycolate phosphatase
LNNRPRLILFDVDGTLADSQASIIAAMKSAFDAIGYRLPSRSQILAIVGLSLPNAFEVLIANGGQALNEKACNAYKTSFANARTDQKKPDFFDVIMDFLTSLRAIPETYLGVATGKSRCGLDALLKGHGIEDWFVTKQVSDNRPSKPHPSMIESAMDDIGVLPDQTVMIGDTSYDIEMAVAAGVYSIGVEWGYHDRARLH